MMYIATFWRVCCFQQWEGHEQLYIFLTIYKWRGTLPSSDGVEKFNTFSMYVSLYLSIQCFRSCVKGPFQTQVLETVSEISLYMSALPFFEYDCLDASRILKTNTHQKKNVSLYEFRQRATQCQILWNVLIHGDGTHIFRNVPWLTRGHVGAWNANDTRLWARLFRNLNGSNCGLNRTKKLQSIEGNRVTEEWLAARVLGSYLSDWAMRLRNLPGIPLTRKVSRHIQCILQIILYYYVEIWMSRNQ